MLRGMRNVLVASLVIACGSPAKPVVPPAPPPEIAPHVDAPVGPVTHVLTSEGRRIGTEKVTQNPDGTRAIVFDVLENGRGPHADITLQLAPDHTLVSYRATGHHTFGAPVDERFDLAGGTATWKSTEEQGSTPVTTPVFYNPISDSPSISGWLIEAALAHGGSIRILPDGTATVTEVAKLDVAANGETKHLVGYRVDGLGMSPSYTWFSDGHWFGDAVPGFAALPEGWDRAAEPLAAKWRELEKARYAKIAEVAIHRPPAQGFAFTHARVLDVEHGRWLADQTVVVTGDTITAVGPKVAVPAGAEVVDLAGKALVPGLFDMHSHLSRIDGVLDLAHGVTTARDVGNDPDDLDELKEKWDDGSGVGPHVYRFGFIEGRNEKSASSKITAETVDEAKAGVEFFFKRHYDGIKIYNSVRPELVPVITAAAHAHGMKVTGHIPVHMLAHEAVEAGYDGIEHVNMLFLNFFATHDTDTRDTTRFTLVGDQAGDFDLNSKPVRDFFKLLRDHKTVLDPTVGAFEDLFVGEQGKVIPGLEAMVDRLPLSTRRGFLIGGLPLDADKRKHYLAAFDKLLAMVKALHDAKLHLVIGTDNIGGLYLDHELELYVRAKIPVADVLRIATIDSARELGIAAKTGSIAKGKLADMFVVDGDPLADIKSISHVVSTMRGGVVYRVDALLQAVSVAPAK
jgi:hypothetical protein